MPASVRSALFTLVFLLSLSACDDAARPTGPATTTFETTAAPEWTQLLHRTSGWFGGDGIFSIPLNGSEVPGSADRTLLIFSDTMIGEVVDDSLQPGYRMVNNTVALLEGTHPAAENVTFHWPDTNGAPGTVFVPETPDTKEGDWYWLGDGFANPALGDSVYIFAYRMNRTDPAEDWSFFVDGVSLITLAPNAVPPFRQQRQIDTPLHFTKDSNEVTFGAGILPNTEAAGVPNPDGYVYVYGIRAPGKKLVAARVRPESLKSFDDWRYWNGSDWVEDGLASAAIADSVSNEMSVTPLEDGRYLLVFQIGGINPYVGVRVGESPVGPFGSIHRVWHASEMEENPDYIAYNAKAHPSLSREGELLVSYNVNSYDFHSDILEDPDLYRPRFFWLRY